MSRLRSTLTASLVSLLLQPGAFAQTDTVQMLVEQGKYWQDQGDFQRAADVWQKLLRTDADNIDALFGMGMVELRAGRAAQAQHYANQLRARGANERAGLLEQEIALNTGIAKQQLAEARAQAQRGDTAQAIASYRSLLEGAPPHGDLALEYYQTLGGTADGWQEARQALERMARENPNDVRTRLALAELLTYRENTRREGIRSLASLANHPSVGKQASESWRRALLWLGDPPPGGDAGLLQAWLSQNPNDAEVRSRLDGIRSGQARARAAANDPANVAASRGFKALDENDLVGAEAEFTAMLRAQPNNANALGGLGIVRLRQQDFPQAVDLLERATKAGSASRWREPLNTARYWTYVHQASTARATGNVAQARQLLERAVKIDPKNATARVALADTLVEAGELGAAEKAYRDLRRSYPNDPDVARGLVGVLAQTGKADEALSIIETLSPQLQARVGELGRLRASRASGLAKEAVGRGDYTSARESLEDALVNDPNNAWIRLELARIYLALGATRDARNLVDGLLLSNPDMPDALFASALLASELQDWPAAMQALDRIQPADRTPEMGALHQRVWVHTRVQAAAQLAQQGRQQEALALLQQAEQYTNGSSELLGAIAGGYADVGDPGRAMGMMRNLLVQRGHQDVGLMLQYATILLKTNQDAELAGALRQLQQQPLTAEQQRNFDDLRFAYVVRQADALRQQGDLATAYDVLAPLLAERPNDPRAVGALARMYADAGESETALEIYRQLVSHNAQDVTTLLEAVPVALAAKDTRFAESTLESALAIAPDNPDVLATAARYYRARGQSRKATEYFQAAIDAQGGGVARAVASGTFTGGGGNPFAHLRRPGAPVASGYARQGAGAVPFPVPGAVRGGQQAPQAVAGYAPANGSGAAPAGAGANHAYANGTDYGNAPMAYAAVGNLAGGGVPQAYIPPPATGANGGGYTQAGVSATPNGWLAGATSTPAMAPQPVPRQAGPAIPGRGVPRTLQSELRDLQAERSPNVTAGASIRARDGESGLSKLSNVQTPIEGQLPFAEGKLALRVTPTTLSSGNVGGDYNRSSRFGGGPEAAVAQYDGYYGSAGSQNQSGVGVALAYIGDRIQADVGTTPLGFEKTNVVGGVRLSGSTEGTSNVSYGVNVSRRAVTDSLLSFAGTRDARTGQTWGAVTAAGARFDIGVNDARYGVYANAGWHSLRGHNVVSNSRFEGGFGIYGNIIKESTRELTVGVNFTGITYDKNLRYFTYGHGGYFSPQRFFSLGFPVTWSGRDDKLTYRVRGSLGFQSFQEDDAPYFPGDSAMQRRAEVAAASAFDREITNNGSATYEGQTKTGLAYNLEAAMEYQLSPQLFMGGTLGLDNARDYKQWAGTVYLRYMLEPSSRPMPMPVSPYRSPYE